VVGVENAEWGLTYYRLDFLDRNSGDQLDILRNHIYECNITAIVAPGLKDPEEAFRSKQYQMEVEVNEWYEGMYNGEIIFDTQYELYISHDNFRFNAEARNASSMDNLLTVITDCPTDWSYSIWLDINGLMPAPANFWLNADLESATQLRLLLDPNMDEHDRIAYIHIQAGRLIYKVKVTQLKPDASVRLVTISPEITSIKSGASQVFSARVFINGAENFEGVTWSLETAAAGVTIDQNGKLTADNTAVNGTAIAIKAVAKMDNKTFATHTLTVVKNAPEESVGWAFEENGKKWYIIKHEAGNLLVVSISNWGKSKWEVNDHDMNYNKSRLASEMKKIYTNSVSAFMKDYAQPVFIPNESPTADPRNIVSGNSYVSPSGTKTCFALSGSETYHSPGFAIYHPTPNHTLNDIQRRVDSRENYWLRTPAKNKKEAIWYVNGTGKANAHDNYDDVSFGIRPAMWVNGDILSEVTLFKWYGGEILD